MNIDGSEMKKLIESKNGFSFSNPKYSPDGKTFLFIESDSNNIENATLCISNIDGSNTKHIIKDNCIITEAIYSFNSEEILYCRANEYSQNSPVGRKDAHGFDIYSFNLLSNRKSKITNLKAYGINNIVEYKNGILFHMESGSNGGIYISEKQKIKEYNPLNNPRKDKSLYNNPIVLQEYNHIAFTAPYELYLMDETKIAKLVYRSENSNIMSLANYHTKPKVLFTKQSELNFYSIDVENKNLELIKISSVSE